MTYTSQLEPQVVGFRPRGTGVNQFEYRSGESALLSLALKCAVDPISMTTHAQKRRLWSPLGMEYSAVW